MRKKKAESGVALIPISRKLKEIKTDNNNINAENIIQSAIMNNVSVETLEKLLAMRKELNAEIAKKNFLSALSQFQTECPTIVKNKNVMNRDGKTIRYSYASVDSIVEQIKPLLYQYGLSYRFDTVIENDWLIKKCIISHADGHEEVSIFKIPIDKEAYMNDAQKVASASSFALRYALCSALGIMTGDEDDDSNSTMIPESKNSVFNNTQKTKPVISKTIVEQPKESSESIAEVKFKEYTNKQGKINWYYYPTGANPSGLDCPICGNKLGNKSAGKFGNFVQCSNCKAYINESKPFPKKEEKTNAKNDTVSNTTTTKTKQDDTRKKQIKAIENIMKAKNIDITQLTDIIGKALDITIDTFEELQMISSENLGSIIEILQSAE